MFSCVHGVTHHEILCGRAMCVCEDQKTMELLEPVVVLDVQTKHLSALVLVIVVFDGDEGKDYQHFVRVRDKAYTLCVVSLLFRR